MLILAGLFMLVAVLHFLVEAFLQLLLTVLTLLLTHLTAIWTARQARRHRTTQPLPANLVPHTVDLHLDSGQEAGSMDGSRSSGTEGEDPLMKLGCTGKAHP